MKPDWKDAPEWAQWLARDENGKWFWYEDRPLASSEVWMTDTRSSYAGETLENWKTSREPRP